MNVYKILFLSKQDASSLQKTSPLVLLREITAAFSENRPKLMNVNKEKCNTKTLCNKVANDSTRGPKVAFLGTDDVPPGSTITGNVSNA